MKREILFRGKCLMSNDWVYGDLIQYNPIPCIKSYEYEDDYNEIEVEIETTGQFTGLTDKNGVKIFEGDKLKITRFDSECLERTIKYELIEIVLWHNCDYYHYRSLVNNKNVELEVIGNTHE